MIEGVSVKKLKVIPDERGRLMEILRCDDECFSKFGQVYMTSTLPGIVKGFHHHEKQTDQICCVYGTIKLVLYDDRKDSSTEHDVDEYFIGRDNPCLITVPPFILHGWKCISLKEALVVNTPSESYNYKDPDENRVDPHNPDKQAEQIGHTIPYDWSKKDF